MDELFDTQKGFVGAVIAAAKEGRRKICGQLPTGGGKGHVCCKLASLSQGRVLYIVRRELLHRVMADKFRAQLGCKVELEQGEHKPSKSLMPAKIIVATAQSLESRDRYKSSAYDNITCVLVDECHEGYEGKFQTVLEHFRTRGATVIGLSATPYRANKKPLDYFGVPVFAIGLKDFIEDGWLVRVRAVRHRVTALDHTLVDEQRTDWDERVLEEVLWQERYAQQIKSLVLQTSNGEPSCVYCADKKQVRLFGEVFDRSGVPVSRLWSGMTESERYENIEAFHEGRTKIILNCQILSYGWDFPPLKHVYMASPTRSLRTYEQRLGRLLRTLPNTITSDMNRDERVAAIAESDKPYGIVHDITNTAETLKVLDVFDVLAEGMAKKLRKKRKPKEDTGGEEQPPEEPPTDTLEDIEAARLRMEEEIEKARKKKANLHVGHSFSNQDVGVFGEASKAVGMRMLYGRYRGELVRNLPTGYLKRLLSQPAPRPNKKGVMSNSKKKMLQVRAVAERTLEMRRTG